MGDLQRQLVKMVESMPAFPNSVHRILQLTTDINCSSKELVKVINHDPVMTLKILRLVNSPYFGFSRKVTTINHAVICVGVNTIKNLALSLATVGVLPHLNKAGMNMTRFLLHSLGTATVAKLIGRRIGATELECNDYFVAGLLHDFGKAVFAQFMPTEYLKVLERAATESIALYQVEQELIGADHCQLGSLLAEKWQLPAPLTACLQDHHAPSESGNSETMIIFVANQITKKLKFGSAGNFQIEEPPAFVTQRLGMNLTDLINDLGDLSSEMNKARIFIHM